MTPEQKQYTERRWTSRNASTESPLARSGRGPASTRISPAYKPGSVGTPRCTGRSFLSACRHRHALAAYPRFTASARKPGSPFETGRLSPPIWPCSGRGLPSHVRYRPCGGLLPHPFTLTASLRRRRFAFCCTVRCVKLAPHAPRRYLATCPVEPGLSSELRRDHMGPSPNFATVRPATSVCRNIAGPLGNMRLGSVPATYWLTALALRGKNARQKEKARFAWHGTTGRYSEWMAPRFSLCPCVLPPEG